MKPFVYVMLTTACAAATLPCWAQTTTDTTIVTTTTPTPPANGGLTISGYAEAYYTHDFTAPKTSQERPGFLYNHKRNREININLAFLKAAYSAERVRANLAIQVGTYAQYNYAAEQPLLRNVFEANAGVKLSKSRDLWLDAGIFGSHIGFESAISKDCWTLTRSLVAENSPYYLSGAKLTYNTPNGKWTLLGSVVNGWQRIAKLPGYSGPALSTQVQYKPNANVVLNWSTFLGSDRPDSLKQTRFYNNVYAILNSNRKVSAILGFDIGADRKPVDSNNQRFGTGSYVWYSPVAIVRYSISDALKLAGRVEYYDDKNGVIIATGTPNGFKTWGYSLNVDYFILPSAVFRIEGKLYNSQDAIFESTSNLSRTNTSLTTSLAVSF
ncbi:porin [Spirosoma sp. RP8]|uniref:Porin n=1 Tax=Spirosoma liriopis TaxID=2937440 RepID=A0ABT0HL31_9BACT|nr:porin [Spirosoma liriopis]MCK8492655.1 porin [Spirosoma liriopis]